uniref:(northern house mosquito) hypothetical protein n=1 Tax=Culex pipiens TaxID=7175 RepID=A0A8D8BP43_CULPI
MYPWNLYPTESMRVRPRLRVLQRKYIRMLPPETNQAIQHTAEARSLRRKVQQWILRGRRLYVQRRLPSASGRRVQLRSVLRKALPERNLRRQQPVQMLRGVRELRQRQRLQAKL